MDDDDDRVWGIALFSFVAGLFTGVALAMLVAWRAIVWATG